MEKNKKLIDKKTLLIGSTTLVVGFLLGLFVTRLTTGREVADLEAALEVASASGAGTLGDNLSPNTGNGDAEILLSAAEVVEINQIRVRVNDGVVQWFDGTYWNDVAPTEELAAQDKFYLAESNLTAFEEQYIAEIQAAEAATAEGNTENNANGDTDSSTPSTINVGRIKKDPPKVTTPAQPETPATGDTGTGSTGDGSTGNAGGSSGGATTAPTSPGTGTTTPSTPTTPDSGTTTPDSGTTTPTTPDTGTTTPSTPTETPSDSNTGDGENMEWSDDYL